MRLLRLASAAIIASTVLAMPCGTALAAPPELQLPFDPPSDDQADPEGRRVYAHYFPQYPISLDNQPADADYYETGLLDPDGEGGNHSRYGGLLRQRPLPRPVADSDDWQLDDMKTEVERAAAAGIDGFIFDILGLSGDAWERLALLLDAAAAVDPDFDIMLMPDANTRTVSDPEALADAIASVADHPSVAVLDDGRLIVSPFLAENKPAEWWQDWLGLMTDRGIEIAFVPLLLDYARNIEAFAPISMGVSVWGGRSPNNIQNLVPSAEDAGQRGLLWMQPVALQDVRPKSSTFDEANNTETFRTMWETAAQTGAEWVQIATWNDYSEQTEIAPSTNTGWSPLAISAYYIAQFKSGQAPAIVRDQIFVSHRVQPVAAEPTGGQTSLLKLRAGSSPARDEVEVLTFLRQGASVQVIIGENTYDYDAPPGAHAQSFPLALGQISAVAKAADEWLLAVVSPHVVTDQPVVQDLQYRFAGSANEGRSVPPTTVPPDTTTPDVAGSAPDDPAATNDGQTALPVDSVAATTSGDGSTIMIVVAAAALGLASVLLVRRSRDHRRASRSTPR